jgi:type IX secretion system PorP/SprF family membrane protein
MMKRWGNIVVLVIGLSLIARAQDPHFSQFFNTHQLYNPAITGGFEDDVRVSAHYKSQWRSAGNGFTTQAFNAEGNFLRNGNQSHAAAGLFAMNDVAGNADWKTLYLMASGAYHLRTTAKDEVSAGFQFAMLQRSLDFGSLKWDSQYDGIQYNPSLASGETLENAVIRRYDVGLGVNWKHEGKYNYSIGYGARHFGQDISALAASTDRWPMRHVIMGRINRNVSFGKLHYEMLIQRQRRFMEITMGARCEYRFGQESRYTRNATSSAVFAGCYYRIRDAVSPVVGFEWKRFLAMWISYNIPLSGVNRIVGIAGGPEISVIYQGRFGDRKMKLVNE